MQHLLQTLIVLSWYQKIQMSHKINPSLSVQLEQVRFKLITQSAWDSIAVGLPLEHINSFQTGRFGNGNFFE